MMRYQVELFADTWEEMSVYWLAHFRELWGDHASIKPNMDIPRYLALEAQQMLHVVNARRNGVLVGYTTALVCGHLHYQSDLHAFYDLYYLAPSYRRNLAGYGYKLLKYTQETLKQRGVKRAIVGTKVVLDISRLLEKLGWELMEKTYVLNM